MTPMTDHGGSGSERAGAGPATLLTTSDQDRVRTLTLNRPEVLNAVNEIAATRERENSHFAALLGGPDNLEALSAFAEGREPDFAGSARDG